LIFDRFEAVAPGRNSIVPHAPYSVSAALFRLIADFGGNSLLTIHNQETEAENEWMLAGKGDFLRLYSELGVDVRSFGGTGKRSLESFIGFFGAKRPMILVHDVATTEGDLNLIGLRPNLFFCLCPNANLYIGGVLPDVEMLVAAGCRLVIGTDSLASNHSLSILEELKTLAGAFPQLGTPTLLRWATADGAAALGMGDRTGSFEAGKMPGVLLLERLDVGRLMGETTVRRLI
jgi:aminodeoxyfutalosine deaminase